MNFKEIGPQKQETREIGIRPDRNSEGGHPLRGEDKETEISREGRQGETESKMTRLYQCPKVKIRGS